MAKATELYTDPSAMEPLFPEDASGELEELSIKLIDESAKLSTSVHEITRKAIADFLRPMNSYYSNLIEGHDTHPIDIERALKGDFSDDEQKRDYQIEAYAHIEVHKYISETINLRENKMEPSSIKFLTLIHEKFYEYLPKRFKAVVSEEGKEKEVKPGQFRADEVKVGSHIAPSHQYLQGFMERFEEFYSPGNSFLKNKIRRIISIAAAHHRLAWIHPFLDGNGRVVRLYSDALFMRENIDASGLWSISRGLARNNEVYKKHLALADLKRQGDYDGRGNLSNKMLAEFCKFFLKVAIDQVRYMATVLETDAIVGRIEALSDLLVIKNGIRPESKYVLKDLFHKGKISKADVMRITNTSDKTAKNITDSLAALGLLSAKVEKGKKAMYFPKYPIKYSPSIFPGLYPSAKESDLLFHA